MTTEKQTPEGLAADIKRLAGWTKARAPELHAAIDRLAALASAQAQQSGDTRVDSGALKMALNVLRRAGKGEVADALEASAVRFEASAQAQQEPIGYANSGDIEQMKLHGRGTIMWADRSVGGDTPLYTAPPVQQAEPMEELRRAVAAIGVVGRIDGHDVVRRGSVLDIIDRRKVHQ